MADPVLLCDGFNYERTAIEAWLMDHDRSPMTNEPLQTKDVLPNLLVKQIINKLLCAQ